MISMARTSLNWVLYTSNSMSLSPLLFSVTYSNTSCNSATITQAPVEHRQGLSHLLMKGRTMGWDYSIGLDHLNNQINRALGNVGATEAKMTTTP